MIRFSRWLPAIGIELSLQSDVLGASVLGIRNILCLAGDHQSFGNQPQAKGVFDIDSVQFVQLVRQMRDEGKILGGEQLSEPPQLFIGAVATFADPFAYRVVRLAKKCVQVLNLSRPSVSTTLTVSRNG